MTPERGAVESPVVATTGEDAAFASRVLEGDREAYGPLVEKYQRAVFACALAITGNAFDAEDAAQETFLRLYQHLDQFDLQRPMKPYLLTIAANCSRSLRARRAAGAMQGLVDIQEVGEPAATGPGPQEVALGVERRRAVHEVMDSLPAAMREVCTLFYLADCTVREVASALSMSEGAVKVALHRARKKLLESPLAEWRLS